MNDPAYESKGAANWSCKAVLASSCPKNVWPETLVCTIGRWLNRSDSPGSGSALAIAVKKAARATLTPNHFAVSNVRLRKWMIEESIYVWADGLNGWGL